VAPPLVASDTGPPPAPTASETMTSPSHLELTDSRYLNRELSWLEFNARVLALAEQETLPLLERAKFLAIYARNLDEFFQIRVSGLREQVEAGVSAATADGMTPIEQLRAIGERSRELSARADLALEGLLPVLDKSGIRILSQEELSEDDLPGLEAMFREEIFPVLTPLSVDPAHPFPFISSLSLNLAVIVLDPMTGVRRFARVKVPTLLNRFVPLPDAERYLPLEDVIAVHLDQLFPGMEIVSHHAFRVTRDADVEVEEDEAEDLLAAIESVIWRRRRAALPVRLEVDGTMSEEARDLLVRELELGPSDIFVSNGLLDLSALSELYELDRADLKQEPWVPVTQPRLADGTSAPELFRVIRAGDILVHHPYDSFATSVEAFVEQAAKDPDVLAIKQTLYRTSSQESPIIRSLVRAAESGKQVVVLVELKARFDEEANITYARGLEEAGVHVVYGVVGLKTHAKMSLIVRRETDGIRLYTHVGTGNYNPVTAKTYEDLGLLTADEDIGADATDLFNLLTGYSRQREYRKLLVAPHYLRPRLLKLIGREAKSDGRIVMKMNSLADADMIDALYEASQAGASIDLIVRGICCLRPGIQGLSDGIKVRSIVGRYLEHSRVFRFGRRHNYRHYIGSADLMPRNLDRRVEAVVPVTDAGLKRRIDGILKVELADDTAAWRLASDGSWRKVATRRDVNAQARLQELAIERARSGRR